MNVFKVTLFLMMDSWVCIGLAAGPADLDRDGDIDLADTAAMQRCFTGAGTAQTTSDCQASRLDDDADVDLADFATMRDCLSGPNDPAVPPCTAPAAPYFPRDAIWYQDISVAPVDAQSSQVITWLQNAGGWGTGLMRIDFSIEVLQADTTTPFEAFIPTEDHYLPDCDLDPVPVPPGGALEGESGYECLSDGDCHLIVVHHPSQRLFEMWRANITDGTFYGGCLAIWNMDRVYGQWGRGRDCTSADASGFPIAPLLFTADEVAAGWIDHAIRFILPNSRIRNRTYVYPGTHATGAASGPSSAPPYAVRLRLRPDFPLAALPNEGARVVARAMQRYGIMLADGGQIALTAQSDRSTTAKWPGLLDTYDLQNIQVSDFEMIEAGPRYNWTGDCTREP